MSKKVNINTLTTKEQKLLIEKTIIKRGLPKLIVKLLLETYSLLLMIEKNWINDENKKEAREITNRNIAHATGEYVIRPVEDK